MNTPESLLFIDGIVEPARLSNLLGVSPANIYQEKQRGLWGNKEFTEMTYIEALTIYRRNLVKSVEAKVEREITEREIALQKETNKKEIEIEKLRSKQTEAQSKKSSFKGFQEFTDEDGNSVDGMHPLLKKKIEQEIKSKRVQEVQGWLKVALEKNNLPNYDELFLLLTPFMQIIKNSLVSLGLDFPETQTRIDSTLNSLADFGEKVLEVAKKHEDDFVQTMLSKDIDTKFAELSFIPENRDEI